MKILKNQNGGHGGLHIGNSCHVKKVILNKCENCIFYCLIWHVSFLYAFFSFETSFKLNLSRISFFTVSL